MVRLQLRVFRVFQKLSQAGMAARLGCKRAIYGHIECGRTSGSPEFWATLQKEFDLTDAEIEELKKLD